LSEILHILAVVLYGAAAVLLGIPLLRGQRVLPRLGSTVAAAGLAAHTAGIAAFLSRWGELPLVGLGPSLSMLAFLIAIGSLIVTTFGGVGPLGLVLAPVVALLSGAAVLIGIQPMGEPTTFGGIWFVLHVLLALAAYAGLTVAFAAGLMYLIQFRELKSKRFGAIFYVFPPLETLDRVGRRALLIGFPALTLALVVGGAWTLRFPEPAGPGNPHIAWGVLTWVVFVAALIARMGSGRTAHRGAMASVLGFTVVVLAFLLLRTYMPTAGAFL
jgi:HemX protein